MTKQKQTSGFEDALQLIFLRSFYRRLRGKCPANLFGLSSLREVIILYLPLTLSLPCLQKEASLFGFLAVRKL